MWQSGPRTGEGKNVEAVAFARRRFAARQATGELRAAIHEMRQSRRRTGPRAVTIRDVAREAGVSVASASRALNGLDNVTTATRERVLESARRLRFVPHTAARSLSTRRTDTIGVMLPDLYGEFFSEIIRGADLAARARGLHLLVSTSHGDAVEAAAAMRSMRGRVDGLLLMSPYLDEHVLAENLPDDLPTVLINTRVEGRRFDSFCVDNHGGAVSATRHLASAGGLVAHIAGPTDNFDSLERLRGYRDALAEIAGGAGGPVLEGDFTEESGWRAGQQLARMRERPAAVFAANDMMAIGCLQALEDEGVRVPGDMMLAGFDDIPVARLIRPSLTTVRIDIAGLGRRALERLARGMADEEPIGNLQEIVRTELVIRESSAVSSGAARTLADRTGEIPI